MSLADTRRVKDLEEVVRKLEERVLMLEMQKRPVEPIGVPFDHAQNRKTITLRGKAA